MVSANAEKYAVFNAVKSVKNVINMGLASPRNHSKIDIKIIQNQIFKDFKYDFL